MKVHYLAQRAENCSKMNDRVGTKEMDAREILREACPTVEIYFGDMIDWV